jgi:putative glutamine amidotransferase
MQSFESAMARPLILVTCWRRHLPTFLGGRTLLDTLDPAYAERVSEAGGQPLLVSRPPDHVEQSARRLIELADGLVLTGGGDVDPAAYGAARENVDADDARADRFELGLIAQARAVGLPTLAICRGAQLLAVAHAGSLAQRPPASEHHGEITHLTPEQILATRHPVSLAHGSRLQGLLERSSIVVNTIHHHQIADAGDLLVSAVAPDDVIEAVEPRTEWPCVGVQWHPEKMGEPEQRHLFEWLVTRARGARPRSTELVG